jgi:hypothetical protein
MRRVASGALARRRRTGWVTGCGSDCAAGDGDLPLSLIAEARGAAGGDDQRHQRQPAEGDHGEDDHGLSVGSGGHLH